jgi:hypothetical protein
MDRTDLLIYTNLVLVVANALYLYAFVWAQYRRKVKYYDRALQMLEDEQGEWYINLLMEREVAKLFKHFSRDGAKAEMMDSGESDDSGSASDDSGGDSGDSGTDGEGDSGPPPRRAAPRKRKKWAVVPPPAHFFTGPISLPVCASAGEPPGRWPPVWMAPNEPFQYPCPDRG